MSTFEERYSKLNPKQKEAVDYINGPLLVVAGPGTGKTEILSLRVANILKRTDMLPKNILCLTFTNSAAYNMRDRLAELIGRDAYKVNIHTFHSFGTDIISSYPEYFYQGAVFTPVDELGQIAILEEILSELEHDNDLSNLHPEGGYVYLRSIREAIGYLKKAGITDEEFKSILDFNKQSLDVLNPLIDSVFSPRISKKVVDIAEGLLDELSSVESAKSALASVASITSVVRESLVGVLDDVAKSGKTSPLSGWKSDMTKPDEQGRRVLKDTSYIDKLYALADVYRKYRERMYKRRYYDYDDMILRAIEGIAGNNALRYELQDKYEYILVDEFQDTNDAQMKLLMLLTDFHQDQRDPNLMAVGDDDQAIFKFQGAELSNIIKFTESYPNTKIITITSNYRSTQDILDLARYLITQGAERLENRMPGIDKNITAAGAAKTPGRILLKSFPTNLHQYFRVASIIREQIEEGKPPSDIAVIARYHRQLEELALVLNKMEVPVTYERHNNVLEEPHIHQLIQIARFVSSLCRKNTDEADEFLPEILSYPFWGLDRAVVWEIAKAAERSGELRLRWLDVMRTYDDEYVRSIADFFLYLGTISYYDTLEHVLDDIMGAGGELIPEGEDDEPENNFIIDGKRFVSPFKRFYFATERRDEDSVQYVRFLSGLRAFVSAIRENKKDELLKIEGLVEFVKIHVSNDIPIIDNSPFVNATDAVNLLTAHKAKGLEFDTVFVLDCQEDIWTGKGRGSNLPLPVNLPIAPAGDTLDDQLRLFYVAVTRAKSNLYLCSYEYKDNGKKSAILPFILKPVDDRSAESNLTKFLTPVVYEPDTDRVADNRDVLATSWESYHALPVVHEERAIFDKILERYQLSVTHMNNFLNVARGGPQLFFEQNLLRFPQSKNLAGAFGSAVHRTLELIYTHLKKTGSVPDLDPVLDWYDHEILLERLTKRQFENFSQKGRDALSVFYEKKIGSFDESHFSEANFRDQGVIVGGAHLSGKIDKMVPVSGGEIEVHDFKTGKPKHDWKGSGTYEKSLLYNYRRQLIFYKLLVENSKDFGDKFQVRRGVLEFVEHDRGNLIDLLFEITDDDVARTTELIKIVYKKIRDLDFPDTAKYKENVEGIIEFEDDLLDGNV